MSRLAELRDRGTAPRPDEKKYISLESGLTELTEATKHGAGHPSVSFVSAISESMKLFSPPAAHERRCYQCSHFQRSPYGYPLGLCVKHDHRIQHATGEPARFGCGDFEFRAPAADMPPCADCKRYSSEAAMCGALSIGCPYPHIPPCHGEHFQRIYRITDTARSGSHD